MRDMSSRMTGLFQIAYDSIFHSLWMSLTSARSGWPQGREPIPLLGWSSWMFDHSRSSISICACRTIPRIRLVTNYDTTDEDVRGFAEAARQALAEL
jgi:hypothetical protein